MQGLMKPMVIIINPPTPHNVFCHIGPGRLCLCPPRTYSTAIKKPIEPQKMHGIATREPREYPFHKLRGKPIWKRVTNAFS